MFGELPKLFERGFAVAFFFPAALFLAAVGEAVSGFGLTGHWTISPDTVIKDTTLFAIAVFFNAILLSLLNRTAVRALEGYWPFGLQRRLSGRQRRRYRQLRDEVARLDELRRSKRANGEDLSVEDRVARIRLKRRQANEFPDAEEWVLPTSFGNIFRAFEIYSRVMYGFDAIPGWLRLLAVIPEEFRALVDAARARLDFWVNVCCLSFLLSLGYSALSVFAYYDSWTTVPSLAEIAVVVIGSLAIAFIAYKMATLAAVAWGGWVKASFDVYLPELRKKLRFPAPATNEEERKLWTSFSRAMLYRAPASLPARSDPAELLSKDAERTLEALSEGASGVLSSGTTKRVPTE